MNVPTLYKGMMRELIHASSSIRTTTKESRIRARNDVEAMERWLDEYFDKATTFRSYKKEAERFLVWCSLRSLMLADLKREDADEYIDFLRDPQPREIWCGPRRKRNDESSVTWYPFNGPLSPTAIKTAVAILNSFLSYLVDAKYLDFNPFSLIRRKTRFKRDLDEQSLIIKERILVDEEWQALLQTIDEEDDSSTLLLFKKERLRFLIGSLYFLGLRLEEFAQAQWCDFKKLNGKWWFFVRGKGDRLGKIPVNAHYLHTIMHYRNAIGLAPVPENEARALVTSFEKNTALSSRQISNIIKELSLKAAKKFATTSISHQKLIQFSAHWLRHLSASRQDLVGISLTHIKENLRHINEQTTRIYVHAYDEERHKDMEKLTLR